MEKIDTDDVENLQLRCPKLCSTDAADIEMKIDHGIILKAFNQRERRIMKEKILSIDYIIPSLHTFLRDKHLLEICAASMRHIVTPGRNMTIRATLKRDYQPTAPEQTMLSTTISPNSEAVPSFDVAMELLWAFVLREFQHMPPPNRKSEGRLLAGYLVKKPDIGTLLRFAKLAEQLGFRTPEINRLSQLAIVSDCEKHPAVIRDNIESRLTNFILQNPNFVSILMTRCLKNLYNGSLIKSSTAYNQILALRCGRPKHDFYQEDRVYITREFFRSNFSDLGVKSPDVPSILVLRSQWLSFFAYPREEFNSSEAYWPVVANANPTSILEHSPAADSINILPDIELDMTPDMNKQKGTEKDFEISEASVINEEDVTTPKKQRLSHLSPISSSLPDTQQSAIDCSQANVKFIEYENGKFKVFRSVDASRADDTANKIMREYSMMLYDLDLVPIAGLAIGDVKNIIILPLRELEITQELRDAAKAYKEDK